MVTRTQRSRIIVLRLAFLATVFVGQLCSHASSSLIVGFCATKLRTFGRSESRIYFGTVPIQSAPRVPRVERRDAITHYDTGHFKNITVWISSGEEEEGEEEEGEEKMRCPKCPTCGSDMIMKKNPRGGSFWGCSNWPHTRCNGYRPVLFLSCHAALHPKEEDIEIREYQDKAVLAIKHKFDEGEIRVACCLATGGGKTSVANAYIARYEAANHVLWMAPAFELLEQAALNRRRHDGDCRQFHCLNRVFLDVEPYPAALSEDVDSEVAYITFQRLYLLLKEKAKLPFPVPDVLIWDELHWAERPKMGQMVLAWSRSNKIRILGLTATPNFDGRFQASGFVIAFALSLVALARMRFLAWPNITTYDGNEFIDLEVEESSDKIPAAMCQASNSEIVGYFVRNSNWCGKTLVKASSIAMARELRESFQAENIDAETITCETKAWRRKEILDHFKKTKGQCVLVVVQIGSTGLDIPDLQTIFLTHNMTSAHAYLQVCGRGARKVEGKSHFGIVEFRPELVKMRKYLWKGLVPGELLSAAVNNG